MFFLLVLFTSTILAISAATWWLWFKFSYFCKLVNQFPGPLPLPLIGNALEILGGGHVLRKKIHEEWATTYGEAFRFFVGSKVYLVVSSPELIELIVNNPKLLGKGSDYDLMRPWSEVEVNLIYLETSKNGDVLSDDDISEEVNTFMFTGSDTTATTLQWFLYCMATNLSFQEKLREELFQVFDDSDRPCTRQDLTELKYLECCVKETLRLYPSVPVFLRIAPENLQIEDYQIPEGYNIAVSTYALNHNPRIYPDPYTYNPDRFFLEQSAGRHPYAFIPFSAGSRNCIGQRFAVAEGKVHHFITVPPV